MKSQNWIITAKKDKTNKNFKITTGLTNLFKRFETENLPLNKNIFYRANKTKDGRSFIYSETGTGEFHSIDGEVILVRERTFTEQIDGVEKRTRGTPKVLECSGDEFYVIHQQLPSSYFDIFSQPNSVLCCNDNLLPSPIELTENSVLGLIDGQLQPLTASQLWSILLSDQKSAVNGSIRYNSDKNTLEGYDGDHWRTITWSKK